MNCGEATDPIRNARPMPKDELDDLKRETAEDNPAEQWLVLRKCPDGRKCRLRGWGCDGKEHVYSTAYSAEEAQEVTKRAVAEHGTFAGIRSVPARERIPKDDLPKA